MNLVVLLFVMEEMEEVVMGMMVVEDTINNTWSASYPGPGVTLVFEVIIIKISTSDCDRIIMAKLI